MRSENDHDDFIFGVRVFYVYGQRAHHGGRRIMFAVMCLKMLIEAKVPD